MSVIDYHNPRQSKEPVKVSDPSQPWKIGIALVFGTVHLFLLYEILITLKK